MSLAIVACGDDTTTFDGGDQDVAVTDTATPDVPETDAGPPECDGCLVDEVCYPHGVSDPSNPCQICDTTVSGATFTPNDGATCDDGLFCTESDACSAGACVGTERSCSDSVACNGVEVCDESAAACTAGETTCTAGQFCDVASDACIDACAGCAIEGVCYGDGQVNALNPCQVCDAATSRSAWSDNDGASCDDGLFCTTGEVCAAGTCGSGTPLVCDDDVACNGTETCNEDADSCTFGTSTCAADELCDVASDSCVPTCTGCVIGGTCFGEGQRNPANQCEVCRATTDASDWTANTGASCDDGLYCNTGETCSAAGACTGGSARACSDGVACNGVEACDESADTCDVGVSTCAAGEMCDTMADACVASCGTGLTECGGSCVDTTVDPAHCGSCDPCPGATNGTTACVSSACRVFCDPGFADCDATPDCETATDSDVNNCGGCGIACGAGQTCDAGVCSNIRCETVPAGRVCATVAGGCWCKTNATFTTGAAVCGYPSGYAGTYYSINGRDSTDTSAAMDGDMARSILAALGETPNPSHCETTGSACGNTCSCDCATNRLNSGSGSWGSSMTCWDDLMRWGRTSNIVRCTNFE